MGDETKIKAIPGVYFSTPKNISEAESKKRIEEMHEKLFCSHQTTEGSRHGNRSFPMDLEDLFGEIQQS